MKLSETITKHCEDCFCPRHLELHTHDVRWLKYPLRKCLWLNECNVCNKAIKSGDFYYDGGFGRRAHKICVLWAYDCAWILQPILAGIGAGQEDWYCINHKKFSGDNHISHPLEKIKMQ